MPWSKSDLNLKTSDIPSPLYYMSYLGVHGVVQLLLNQKVDVNAKGGICGYALAAASNGGHENVVQLLLENGPMSTLKVDPMELRCQQHHTEVTRL